MIFLVVAIGVVLGLLLFRPKWHKPIANIQTVLTLLLIFAMGVSFGRMDGFLDKLSRLGLESLVFAVLSIIGSVFVVYLLTKIRKKEANDGDRSGT